MKNTIEITKDFQRNIDAGSSEYIIEVKGYGFELDTIRGNATYLSESGTYHLDADFENALEAVGIDYDEVRDVLEEGVTRYLEVDIAPTMSLKEKLDVYAKTALELKMFTVASRLCIALDTAHRVDMNTPEDFGGEWASIECDIESVTEAMDRANQEDLDARERFEGEQLKKLDYEV